MTTSALMAALEQFDATEANLVKAEKLWAQMSAHMPTGLSFGTSPEFEQLARLYRAVIEAMPKIDGFRPSETTVTPNDVAQANFDAQELGEPYGFVAAGEMADEPARELAEYRFQLLSKRRALVRDALTGLIDLVDQDLRRLTEAYGDKEPSTSLAEDDLGEIRTHVGQIEVLIGSNPRPERWSDLRRHLHFGMVGDFNDITRMDWPAARAGLRGGLYGESEPLPVPVADLSDLVAARPTGPVSQALSWEALSDEQFERLLYDLISTTEGYENPEWLMRTNAPDRGRDLSVTRVASDRLSGVSRRRVIIQCKHWTTKSVSLDEVAKIQLQMDSWRDPPVDVLVFATSGRFTTDAVSHIEGHNAKRATPTIEMWAESRLENLLAARPDLVANYRLR